MPADDNGGNATRRATMLNGGTATLYGLPNSDQAVLMDLYGQRVTLPAHWALPDATPRAGEHVQRWVINAAGVPSFVWLLLLAAARDDDAEARRLLEAAHSQARTQIGPARLDGGVQLDGGA